MTQRGTAFGYTSFILQPAEIGYDNWGEDKSWLVEFPAMFKAPETACRFRKSYRIGWVVAALFLGSAESRAITLTLDYTYDTTNFFGAGNPSGAAAGTQAKTSLEAAAGFFSNLLNDTLSAVTIPPDFHSTVFNGVAFWDTTLQFNHPATGSTVTLNSQTRAADEYRIYAGARNLGGTTLGVGGPTSAGWSQDYTGDGFTQAELDQIDAITAAFETEVETRGEASGFSAWGGVLSFDSVGTTWHYNHTTVPSGSVNDFYSVAIHELGHALGIGASPQWSALASGPNFTGAAATAAYGSAPPLESPNPTRAHWASGTMSTVFGTGTPQEAAMDPEITQGTRKLLTTLDAAALTDIGWEINATPPQPSGDFNGNGVVDAADYVLWRNGGPLQNDPSPGLQAADYNFWRSRFGATSGSAAGIAAVVPEPSTLLVAIAALATVVTHRRRTLEIFSQIPR